MIPQKASSPVGITLKMSTLDTMQQTSPFESGLEPGGRLPEARVVPVSACMIWIAVSCYPCRAAWHGVTSHATKLHKPIIASSNMYDLNRKAR